MTITEVSDPTLANVVMDTGSTSACGGATNGVLGCYDGATGEITLIQGWNWYEGADPSQIGAAQYDFQTTVTHELGHALGLGHSANPSSPMYATLAGGVADRTVATEDRTCIAIAAGFSIVSATGSLSPNGYTPSPGAGPSAGPVGLMPLPVAGVTGTSVSTLLMPQPNLPEKHGWSVAQPAVYTQTDWNQSAVDHGTDREDEPVRFLTRPRSDLVPDSVLDELASDRVGRMEDGGRRTEERPILNYFSPQSSVFCPSEAGCAGNDRSFGFCRGRGR